MATINQSLCPSLISCGITTTKLETKFAKHKKDLKWLLKLTISDAEMKALANTVFDALDNGPKHCGGPAAIAEATGYPVVIVQKIWDEYLTTWIDFHNQQTAEGVK